MRGASILCFGALAAVTAPHMALAQTVPNLGNYQDLKGAFRIGVQVTNQLNGFGQSASFEQDTIEDITDYLDPSQIATVVGAVNAQLGQIQTVFDLRGATAVAGYAQNGSTLILSFVSPSGQVINQLNGSPCTFTFNGGTRQASFDIFDAAVDDETTPTSQAVLGCIGRAFARYSPIDPLAGNPSSLQSTLARSALDFASSDSLIEESASGEEGANTSGDPWIVGGAFTTGGAGRFDINRMDARIQRSFRIFEGNRALLKFELPFNYTRVSGTKAYSAQLGLGLEMPVIDRRWSLEPRISYGVVYSKDAGSAGHILQGSVTSRYVISGVGRGRVVIGNMVGYSQTLDPPGTDANINPDLKNIILRNGLAYDLPLKGLVGGRSTSVRASYGFTAFIGDKLRNNTFHEATLSFGLRGREESTRAKRDLIRFNISTVQAKGYHSYTAGLGFRF